MYWYPYLKRIKEKWPRIKRKEKQQSYPRRVSEKSYIREVEPHQLPYCRSWTKLEKQRKKKKNSRRRNAFIIINSLTSFPAWIRCLASRELSTTHLAQAITYAYPQAKNMGWPLNRFVNRFSLSCSECTVLYGKHNVGDFNSRRKVSQGVSLYM